MRGRIIHYSPNDGKGLIAAADGQQYPLEISQWRSGLAPRVNQVVDLEPHGNRARAVALVPATTLLRESLQRTCRRIGNWFGFGQGPPTRTPDTTPPPTDKSEE